MSILSDNVLFVCIVINNKYRTLRENIISKSSYVLLLLFDFSKTSIGL
jgi:hypothetical protein